jgi:hypothetical protein
MACARVGAVPTSITMASNAGKNAKARSRPIKVDHGLVIALWAIAILDQNAHRGTIKIVILAIAQ